MECSRYRERHLKAATRCVLSLLACALTSCVALAPHANPSIDAIKAEKSAEAFLRETLDSADFDENTRYFDGEIDLDGDGIKEVIVYLVASSFCGSGGCPTLVFSRTKKPNPLVTEISVSHTPIVVLPTKTKGWRDLAVEVYGGGIVEGYAAKLRFDGRTYPENPTVAPAIAIQGEASGDVIIPAFDDVDQGKRLSKPL